MTELSVTDGLVADHPYHSLASVLNDAFLQAAAGKGKARHAQDLPFHEQRMQQISDLLNSERGMAYQVCKKVAEGLDLPTTEAKIAELLGAIVYTAGIVVRLRREQADADGQASPYGITEQQQTINSFAEYFARANALGPFKTGGSDA